MRATTIYARHRLHEESLNEYRQNWPHSGHGLSNFLSRHITPSLLIAGPVGRSFTLSFPPKTQTQGGSHTKVPKGSQLPQDGFGKNIGSDVDRRQIMLPPTARGAPSWVVAGDFICDGTPIGGVRWWRSYFDPNNEPQPNPDGTALTTVIEDGLLISFFRDIPVSPINPDFSRPGELLGSYIADVSVVMISPTGMTHWDEHPIWQCEVMIADTDGDHLIAGLSEPHAFLETAGEIYWISIAAENGHRIEPATWEPIDTMDPVEEEHFWRWHTSPTENIDLAVMGDLQMPGSDWLYGNWNPVETVHLGDEMAFELLTIVPEASSIVLAVIGMGTLVCVGWQRRRRRAREIDRSN